MHEKPAAPRPPLRLHANLDHPRPPSDRPAFQPIIALDDVFVEMIRAEIRNGRLSAWRRRRIVQFAAQLNLSAVEAGRLIEQCRADWQAESRDSDIVLRLRGTPLRDRSPRIGFTCVILGLSLLVLSLVLR